MSQGGKTCAFPLRNGPVYSNIAYGELPLWNETSGFSVRWVTGHQPVSYIPRYRAFAAQERSKVVHAEAGICSLPLAGLVTGLPLTSHVRLGSGRVNHPHPPRVRVSLYNSLDSTS